MVISEANRIAVKSELCRRSFYCFAKEFLSIIEPNYNNFVWNWHIEFLCTEFQKVVIDYMEGKGTKHVNINICPGTTKSTIFSRLAVPWVWTVFPSATIINVSRDSNNVKNFAIKSKEIINSEKYKTFFPEISIKSSPDSVFYFENNHGGVRYGLTTTSKGATGKHADFQIWDDVYSYQDTEGSLDSVKTLEGYLDGLLSRFKNKDTGILFNVMQRLAHNDPTAYLFGKNGKLENYKNICLPAQNSDLVHPPELKEKYINGLLDPKRLSREVLKKEKRKYGFRYEAQFEQQATLSPEGLLYPNINYYDEIEIKDVATYSFTDPANSGDDYLCTWFMALHGDKVYVYDCIYTKNDINTTLPRLRDKFQKENCIYNFIEANGVGGTFASQLMTSNNVTPYHEKQPKEVKLQAYAHLIDKFYFKENHENPEYRKALEHLKATPKKIPNKGKGMDIDAADAMTTGIKFFYKTFQHLFL